MDWLSTGSKKVQETWICELFPLNNWKTKHPKVFADDNFEFDESGRKFSKRIENTVRKREIAHYEMMKF